MAAVLAEVAVGIGPRGVEVPQQGVTQAVGPGVVLDEPLGGELGRAVRGLGRLGRVLAQRHLGVEPVGRRRAAEEDLAHPGGAHGVEHALGPADVDPVVSLGIGDRIGDRRQRREVHHRLDAVLAQHLGQTIGVGDVADDQPAGGLGDRRGIPLEQVVIGDRIVPVVEQPAKAGAADVARAAGQEDLHRSFSLIAKNQVDRGREVGRNQGLAGECFRLRG